MLDLHLFFEAFYVAGLGDALPAGLPLWCPPVERELSYIGRVIVDDRKSHAEWLYGLIWRAR
jgi:hypothetical protein